MPKQLKAKRPELKDARVELIEWDDAETDSGWKEVPKNLSHAIATSLGWVVLETKSHLLLASSVDYKEGTVNGTFQIPKGMIRKRTVVTLPQPSQSSGTLTE